jgi:hypothetical protein
MVEISHVAPESRLPWSWFEAPVKDINEPVNRWQLQDGYKTCNHKKPRNSKKNMLTNGVHVILQLLGNEVVFLQKKGKIVTGTRSIELLVN